MNLSRTPRSAQPDRLEKVRLDDARSATCETVIWRASPWSNATNAPWPAAAHHRRLNAGADTTPTTGTPSTSKAISVAQIGRPRTKFLVPSMGSTTHCRPVRIASPPNSSPRTSSSGNTAARRSRIICSQARSASETGVRSGLASTSRSIAPKRPIVSASADSARESAKSRSAVASESGVGSTRSA